MTTAVQDLLAICNVVRQRYCPVLRKHVYVLLAAAQVVIDKLGNSGYLLRTVISSSSKTNFFFGGFCSFGLKIVSQASDRKKLQ
jgi:hypothetical protein